MSDDSMSDFIRERNEALLSLDRNKIEAYLKKYKESIPKNENVFWAAIHKARLAVTDFSEDVKEVSREWLTEHGFKPEF